MYENLKQKIENRQSIIGIIGLGYVGLPLGLSFCEENYRVIGFDIDSEKVQKLMNGESYIKHISSNWIEKYVKSDLFQATDKAMKLAEADIIIVCVPTPLGLHHEPDVSYIIESSNTIKKILKKGQLVILESTSYPGTTEEVMKPILESTGLKTPQDFFLSFSPEREDPGNKEYTTRKIPKVVGADDPQSRDLADRIYSKIVKTVVVSNNKTAEAVKITENIFRCINIALVNELKMIYSEMGIDIWEVIEAAKTKPFGFMPFYPGPGLGGHCIPIDPFYLTWKAKEFGYPTRFIELAGEINTNMPRYVVERLLEEFNLRKKNLNGSKVLMIGVAYKRDVDDFRESPAFPVYQHLIEANAQVDYYDPFIPEVPKAHETGDMIGKKSVILDGKKIQEYDVVLIITDHSDIDYQMLVENANLVMDTRNATKKVTGPCRSKILFA